MAHTPIIEMRSISKSFGQVQANADVDFTLQRGEIHAIVGENGAGKSTLMKILYGLYQPDEGEIFVDGLPVTISSPKSAMRLGLGMIQQHFTLIPAFTALQNIILAKEKRKFGTLLDYQKAENEITELAEQVGFDVPLNTPIESLSIGAQQHTEILKALYHGAEILIMDEPTAVLVPQEIEGLFECMRGLKREGRSIIIITHKLDEVMTIADTATVMRRGKTVATCPISETNSHQLAEHILGEPVLQSSIERKEINEESPILHIEDVTVRTGTGKNILDGINLNIFPGEIVGIAGVEGNGQTELIEILTGLRKIQHGNLVLNGESVTNCSASEFREKQVAHLPADRHRHGVSLNNRIDENFIIGKHQQKLFSRNAMLHQKNIQRFAFNALDKYQIRVGDIKHLIKTLSGGNQQKVVVARELSGDPALIIAAHPTRGLDIHAAKFVHTRLIQARNRGKAVLLVSSELDELLLLSDRIAVMYNGKIAGIVIPTSDDRSKGLQEKDKQKLGALMLGLSLEH
ncbi:MAG: ABC transporter ATP-binding protein [Candidatus Poribacteria bacterium]|nr:ABC transporter ATP-binding protein [Candidatus Poribacteria bacterium]